MKTYSIYLLGVIIPAAINFFAIPIFKRVLGEAMYGEYNLLLTTLLMCNMIAVGWISQSIIRLTSQAKDKSAFVKNSLWVSSIVSLSASVLAAICMLFLDQKLVVVILFSLLLFISGLQLILNGVAQFYLKASAIMYAEIIRVGLGFCAGYYLVIQNINQFPIEKLFLALIVSNFISSIILFKSIPVKVSEFKHFSYHDVLMSGKDLLSYGMYLMLWYFCTYALMYNDRYWIFYQVGKDVTGHYTSLFDIISRTVNLSAIPLLISTFPLLSLNYDKGEMGNVNKLLKRMLTIELVCTPLALVAYWVFGYSILEDLLRLPSSDRNYFWAGFFILTGSILGQISMVVHKRLELRKETPKMFWNMLFVLIGVVLGNILVIREFGFLGSSFMYMLGTATYLAIVTVQTHKI